MVKHTNWICVLYHLPVQLVFVLPRVEETSTLSSVDFAERVEGNKRNKQHLALQRSLVHDKLQEIIARITWS